MESTDHEVQKALHSARKGPALLRLHFPPVKDPAPPGIFFTAAAFDKYSVAARLKQARADKAGSAQAFGYHLSPLREPSDVSEGPPDEEDFLSSSSSEGAPNQAATSDAAGQLGGRAAERLSSGQRAGPSGRGPADSSGVHSPRAGTKRKRGTSGVQAARLVQEEAPAVDPALSAEHTGHDACDADMEGGHGDMEDDPPWEDAAPEPGQVVQQRADQAGVTSGAGMGAQAAPSKSPNAGAGADRQHGSHAGKATDGRAARPASLPAPVGRAAGSPSVAASAPVVPQKPAGRAPSSQQARPRAAPRAKPPGAVVSKPKAVPQPAAGAAAAAPADGPLSEHAAANAAIARILGASRSYSFQAPAAAPPAAAAKPAGLPKPKPRAARKHGAASLPANEPAEGFPKGAAVKRPVPAQRGAPARAGSAPVQEPKEAMMKSAAAQPPDAAESVAEEPRAAQAAPDLAGAVADLGGGQGEGGLAGEAGAGQGQRAEGDAPAAEQGGDQGQEGGDAEGDAPKRQPRALLALLNPTDPRYDPAFAAEYAAVREAAGRGKRAKLKPGRPKVWSKIKADDHAWFLEHQGAALGKKEAEKYGRLAARVAEEQQAFLRVQWAGAGAHPERYAAADARGTAQLDAHLAGKRADVLRLPRLWSLHSRLSVGQLADTKLGAPRPVHLSSVHAEGTPAPFTAPRSGTAIDLDLPLFPVASPAATSQGEGGAGGAGGAAPGGAAQKPRAPPVKADGTALRIVADKRAAVVLAASAFRALAGMQAPALSPGWEIPVTLVEQRAPPREGDGAEQAGCAAPSSAPRLVACFGKPLVKRLMSARERLELLHKHALRTLGANPHLARRRAEGQKGGWRASLMDDLLQELQPESAAPQPAAAAAAAPSQPCRHPEAAQHSAASKQPCTVGAPINGEASDQEQPSSEGGPATLQGGKEQQEGEKGAASLHAGVEPEDAADEGGEGDGDDLSDMLEAELASGEEQDAPDDEAAAIEASGPNQATRDDAVHLAPASYATRYELWRLGDMRLVTRAHVRSALQPAPNSSSIPGAGLEVAVKIEYHGDEEADREEVIADELARWWAGAVLRPGAQALVGHVGAASSRLLAVERLSAAALADAAAAAGYSEPFTWRLLAGLARAALRLNRPGRYLLTHAPGSPAICAFAALPEQPPPSDRQVQPLPCYTGDEAGTVYDLWAAHHDSGGTDETQVPFIPKKWRPSHPDVPHIPYTFPPKSTGPGSGRGGGSNSGGRRRGGRGGGNALGRGKGKQPQGKRARKMPPTAWTIGQRPDWDEIPQNEAAGNADFSAQEYAQLLGEELDG